MSYVTDSFSSYPHSTTFGNDGGEMSHTSDGFKITVPQGAISTGQTVQITVDFEDISSGLPATKPGATFTKVSRTSDPSDESGYKINVANDYQFNSDIDIRFWKRNPTGLSVFKVYCTTGGVNPTNWYPRDGSPWSESYTFARSYVTLHTDQVNKPRETGADESEYFVVGAN